MLWRVPVTEKFIADSIFNEWLIFFFVLSRNTEIIFSTLMLAVKNTIYVWPLCGGNNFVPLCKQTQIFWDKKLSNNRLDETWSFRFPKWYWRCWENKAKVFLSPLSHTDQILWLGSEFTCQTWSTFLAQGWKPKEDLCSVMNFVPYIPFTKQNTV